MACLPCNSGIPLFFDVQSFINNSCSDCTQTPGCIPSTAVCYTGANLSCSGINTNDTLSTSLQKIDTQICSAIGDYSTYQFNCLIAWWGSAITQESQFVDAITSYVCSMLAVSVVVTDTPSINFSVGHSSNIYTITGDVKLSATGGNGLSINSDGLYSSTAATTNIYNSNGTLSGDRVLTGATHNLSFNGLGDFVVVAASSLNLQSTGGTINISGSTAINLTANQVQVAVSNSNGFNLALTGSAPLRLNGDAGTSGWALTSQAGAPPIWSDVISTATTAITANNGLTKSSSTNIQLGGTLLQDTTLISDDYIFTSYKVGTFNSEGSHVTMNTVATTLDMTTGGGSDTLYDIYTSMLGLYGATFNANQTLRAASLHTGVYAGVNFVTNKTISTGTLAGLTSRMLVGVDTDFNGGTLSNFTGVRIAAPNQFQVEHSTHPFNGIITNLYGIHIDDTSTNSNISAQITNRWGIYQEGAIDLNYFNAPSGFRTTTPTSSIDINGTNGHNQLRLRNSYTPTSSADLNGSVGDVAWDVSFFYIKTGSGWRRTAISSF